MLKWWHVPPYPDWINAESTIIWLVTFQIQLSNSNFQIQNKLLCLPVLLQNVFLKLINNFVFIGFILVDAFSSSIYKDREITKNLFTLAENYFGERNFRAPAWTSFKTHQHFCFQFFSFSLTVFPSSIRTGKSKKYFYLSRKLFRRKKLSCTCLNFGEILFAGTKRTVPGEQ